MNFKPANIGRNAYAWEVTGHPRLRPAWYRDQLMCDRIRRVLARCSVRRWIGRTELKALVERWASKRSQNPTATVLGAFDWRGLVAVYRGHVIHHEPVEWYALEREAIAAGNRYSDIREGKWRQLDRLYKREREVLATRAFINRLKKEVRSVQVTQVMR